VDAASVLEVSARDMVDQSLNNLVTTERLRASSAISSLVVSQTNAVQRITSLTTTQVRVFDVSLFYALYRYSTFRLPH
jgi:hypothetical protein